MVSEGWRRAAHEAASEPSREELPGESKPRGKKVLFIIEPVMEAPSSKSNLASMSAKVSASKSAREGRLARDSGVGSEKPAHVGFKRTA